MVRVCVGFSSRRLFQAEPLRESYFCIYQSVLLETFDMVCRMHYDFIQIVIGVWKIERVGVREQVDGGNQSNLYVI